MNEGLGNRRCTGPLVQQRKNSRELPQIGARLASYASINWVRFKGSRHRVSPDPPLSFFGETPLRNACLAEPWPFGQAALQCPKVDLERAWPSERFGEDVDLRERKSYFKTAC